MPATEPQTAEPGCKRPRNGRNWGCVEWLPALLVLLSLGWSITSGNDWFILAALVGVLVAQLEQRRRPASALAREPTAAEPTRERPSRRLTWRSIGLTLALLVVVLWAAQHEGAFKSQALWCIVAALAGLLVGCKPASVPLARLQTTSIGERDGFRLR
jgi:peptidoglycan/LPS O-acetylase OafA/YrhL